MNPAAELGAWFPGVHVWHGRYTGSWWAYVPGHPPRLLEAPDLQHLTRKLATTAPRPLKPRGPMPYQ